MKPRDSFTAGDFLWSDQVSWYQGTKKTGQKPESSLNSTRSGELQESLRSIPSRPWLNLLEITCLFYNHLWWPEHSIHQIRSLTPARSNTWVPIPKQWSIFLLPIHFRLWGSAWLTDFFSLFSIMLHWLLLWIHIQVTSIIALDVTPTPSLVMGSVYSHPISPSHGGFWQLNFQQLNLSL